MLVFLRNTRHCVHASTITTLFQAGIPTQQIVSITKHKDPKSLGPYISDLSEAQKRGASNTLSNALGITSTSVEGVSIFIIVIISIIIIIVMIIIFIIIIIIIIIIISIMIIMIIIVSIIIIVIIVIIIIIIVIFIIIIILFVMVTIIHQQSTYNIIALSREIMVKTKKPWNMFWWCQIVLMFLYII